MLQVKGEDSDQGGNKSCSAVMQCDIGAVDAPSKSLILVVLALLMEFSHLP
jgi:hypothetical protein